LFDSLYLALGEPFAGVSGWVIATIAILYFVCFLARGAVGFGALAPAVTFTSWLIDPHHAVLLAIVAATVPQLQLLPGSLRGTDWQVARPVLWAIAVTTAVGAWIFARISGDTLSTILGFVISGAVIADTFKLLERAFARVDLRKPSVAFALAGFSGFVTGLAGVGGMITLVLYLKHACTDHAKLRHTTIVIGTLILAWRCVLVFLTGLVSLKLLTEAAIMLPVIYAGVWLGSRVTRNASTKQYHRVLQALLLLSALGLLAEGIWKLL
jgi:uncharacterized membrane protein YfcA